MRAEAIEPGRGSSTRPCVATPGRWRPGPGVALGVLVVTASALVQRVPALASAAELDRAALSGGQWWRVLTCHWAHWGWAHWAGDISALVALWWLAEDRLRWVGPMCLTAAVCVGLAVTVAAPDVTSYRGMSGVTHALLVWVLLARSARTRGALRIGCVVALVGVAGKIACEFTMEAGAKAYSLPEGIVLVPVAHLAGAGVGAAVCAVYLALGVRRQR